MTINIAQHRRSNVDSEDIVAVMSYKYSTTDADNLGEDIFLHPHRRRR